MIRYVLRASRRAQTIRRCHWGNSKSISLLALDNGNKNTWWRQLQNLSPIAISRVCTALLPLNTALSVRHTELFGYDKIFENEMTAIDGSTHR
jgi:hypothetical protein